MKGIFLDDARWPLDVTWVDYKEHIEWTTVCDSKTFAIALQEFVDSGEDFAVSFDHDLQEYHEGFNGEWVEITGYDILKAMLSTLLEVANEGSNGVEAYIPDIYFHTQNSVGRKNMETYLANFMKAYY